MCYLFLVCILLENSILGEFSNIYHLSSQSCVKWRHKIRPIAKMSGLFWFFFARDDAKLITGEVCKVSCRYSTYEMKLFRKNRGGRIRPPRRWRKWRHCWPLMNRWVHDLISSHLSVKWMSVSKSSPQINLESNRIRKVGKGHWPDLTSVGLGWPALDRMTCGKHEYYLGLHIHIHITSKNGDACTQTCVRLWVESWVDSWVNGFCLSHELIRIHVCKLRLSHELIRIHVFKKSTWVRVESIQLEFTELSHESQKETWITNVMWYTKLSLTD